MSDTWLEHFEDLWAQPLEDDLDGDPACTACGGELPNDGVGYYAARCPACSKGPDVGSGAPSPKDGKGNLSPEVGDDSRP